MIVLNVVSVVFALFGGLLIFFDAMSIMLLPAVYTGLHYMCNDVDLIQITDMATLDDFQCNINVKGKHLNTIIYQVPCAIYDKIYDKQYNNTLVKFNHYDPNNCFDIVTSKEEFPKNYYTDDIKFMNFIYYCWIVTIIGAIGAFAIKERYDHSKRELEVGC
jgi:hypothetical protein